MRITQVHVFRVEDDSKVCKCISVPHDLPPNIGLASSKKYLALKPLETPSEFVCSSTFRPIAPRFDSNGPGAVIPQYLPTIFSVPSL